MPYKFNSHTQKLDYYEVGSGPDATKVDKTTTVNGQPLSADVNLTASEIDTNVTGQSIQDALDAVSSDPAKADKTSVILSNTNIKLLLHLNGSDDQVSTVDSSTFAHTVTFNGDVKLDSRYKKFGTAALLLDGTGDYLSIPDSAEFFLDTNIFSFDFWYRPTTIVDNVVLFSQVEDTNNYIVCHTGAAGDGIYITVVSGGSVVFSNGWGGFGGWQAGQWFYINIRRESDGYISIQINLVNCDTGGDPQIGIATSIPDFSGDFYIGTALGISGLFNLNGTIDEFRFIKGAIAPVDILPIGEGYVDTPDRLAFLDDLGNLKDNDITKETIRETASLRHDQNSDTKLDEGESNEVSASELRVALDTTIPSKTDKELSIETDPYTKIWLKFDNGLTDSGPNGHIFGYNGTASNYNYEKKYSHGALSLPVAGDFISSSNFGDCFLDTNPFTIDFWVYFTSSISSHGFFSMIANNPDTYFSFGTNASGQVYLYITSATVGLFDVIWDSNAELVINKWQHIELTRETNGYIYLRINGVQRDVTYGDPQIGIATSIPDYSTGDDIIEIGINGDGGQFVGYIDEFKFSNGIARHTANFRPSLSEYPGFTSDRVPYISPDGNLKESTMLTKDLERAVYNKSLDGQMITKVKVVDANYDVLHQDCIIAVNASGAVTINLEDPAYLQVLDTDSGLPWTQRIFIIKDISGNASVNNITVQCVHAATRNIDGVTSKLINSDYGVLKIYCDDTNYWII